MERRVTVRVDLVGGGNLGDELKQRTQEADKLDASLRKAEQTASTLSRGGGVVARGVQPVQGVPRDLLRQAPISRGVFQPAAREVVTMPGGGAEVIRTEAGDKPKPIRGAAEAIEVGRPPRISPDAFAGIRKEMAQLFQDLRHPRSLEAEQAGILKVEPVEPLPRPESPRIVEPKQISPGLGGSGPGTDTRRITVITADRLDVRIIRGAILQVGRIQVAQGATANGIFPVQTGARPNVPEMGTIKGSEKDDKGLDKLNETTQRLGRTLFWASAGMTGLTAAASPDALATLTGSIQLLAGEIGMAFIPTIRSVSGWLQQGARWVRGLSSETKDAIGYWGGIGVASLGAAYGIASVVRTGRELIPVVTGAGSAVRMLFTGLSSLAVFSLANPFTAIIVAIGGAAAAMTLFSKSAESLDAVKKRIEDLESTLDRFRQNANRPAANATQENFQQLPEELRRQIQMAQAAGNQAQAMQILQNASGQAQGMLQGQLTPQAIEARLQALRQLLPQYENSSNPINPRQRQATIQAILQGTGLSAEDVGYAGVGNGNPWAQTNAWQLGLPFQQGIGEQGIQSIIANIERRLRQQMLQQQVIVAANNTAQATGTIPQNIYLPRPGSAAPVSPTAAAKGASPLSGSDSPAIKNDKGGVMLASTFQPQILQDATQLYDRILLQGQKGELDQANAGLQMEGNAKLAGIETKINNLATIVDNLGKTLAEKLTPSP